MMVTAPPLLQQGLSMIVNDYDAFILDIWGVLHDGIRVFPGTLSCLHELQNQGKQIVLLSNTPDRSMVVSEHLAMMGIARNLYDHIVTAGESAWQSLKYRSDAAHQQCGTKCFFAGSDFMADAQGRPLFIQGLDLTFVTDMAEADFILNVCGGTRRGDYEQMWYVVKEALAHGLPMVCTNPDLVVNLGAEQYLCAGTFARFYEEHGGQVLYHGKPHRPIYETAWSLLGQPDKSRIVAIGDSLHTDIRGAHLFGIDSVFNFSGIHGDEIKKLDQHDTFFTKYFYRPTYLMEEFLF